MLVAAGIRVSMDGRGRWIDNVFIQRLWRSLVSGVPREHRSDWGRRQVAYIVADAHLLVPKLRTLSPHDSAATACRNDCWNALERVRLLDLARRV
jgi:hypothetical protein